MEVYMTDFWKMVSRQEINARWDADLTDWLVKCKGIPNVTQEDLRKWDAILNNSPSTEDLKSFCSHTGWKYGSR
jgi:hypothetical protein